MKWPVTTPNVKTRTAPAATTAPVTKPISAAKAKTAAARKTKKTAAATSVTATNSQTSEAEMENEKHRHPCHKQEIPRLNRVIGQLEGVKKMIEELRYCPDILIQLRAARSAIRAVESNILKTHLQSCVAQSFASEEDKEQKLNELKELFDRFES